MPSRKPIDDLLGLAGGRIEAVSRRRRTHFVDCYDLEAFLASLNEILAKLPR